ncbi:MAG: methyltransferase domain-containing protein [Ectothiorhodospiraceae bacterium]
MNNGTSEPDTLHEARLRYALGALLDSGARTLVDIGCGSGALLKPAAAHGQFRHLLGLEVSGEALAVARRELAGPIADGRVEVMQTASLEGEGIPEGFDAAALVETIEHIDPRRLQALEAALFERAQPDTVVITTPNREYNTLYGLAPGERRDPDHRFEWDRHRFAEWARRLARRYGYRVVLTGIGEGHPDYGCPTQAACLRRSH